MRILLFLFVLCAQALGQQFGDAPAKEMIRGELLIVRVPMATALALKGELKEPKTTQQGMDKLLAFVEKGEAELVDWPTVTTHALGAATVNNWREVRFPTAYQMPRAVPETPSGPPPNSLPAPTAPPIAPEEKPVIPVTGESTPSPLPMVKGPEPTTFNMRQVGVGLELDMNVQAGSDAIETSVRATHVSLRAYRRESIEVKGQYQLIVDQPVFDTRQTAIKITLKSGQPQMIGFFKLDEPKDTMEIFILKATLIEPLPDNPANVKAPNAAGE